MPSTVDELRARLSLGVVAVVGAGLSLSARYPNTPGLNALLWDAIDADPDARARLAERLGVSDAPAKALIGDDRGLWEESWRTIEESATCRRRFQKEFVNLDRRRAGQPSTSHDALARMIHSGIVECVISFNWDSALESAYRRLYGTKIPAGVLYKPHGDVAYPGRHWTLPHERGLVTDDVLARVREFVAEHPRTLLVVGYSGSDRVVVEQLIDPLDDGWRVARIGPSVEGKDDIVGTAAEVLSALAADVARREDESAWHVVTFSGQRGIEAALEGHRLQPTDVEACPRLPEASLVANALVRNHAVVINGKSGSGKSITAYQVLHELCKAGFEVLRLRDRARDAGLGAWLEDLSLFPHRKVLFVDDAQDLSADLVRELAETATADRLVLVVGVDHVAGGVTTLSMVDAPAIGALEQHVRENRAEMLAKVRQLDDRVGDGPGDESFDERLSAAAREETAWQFFFTLTGGWRRMSRSVQEVRGDDRADLAALALAVAQVAGVDAGVTAGDLVPYAEALGRDRQWVERSLALLRSKRLAVADDGVWRCAHLRAARALIRWMLYPPVWDVSPIQRIVIPPIASAAPTSVLDTATIDGPGSSKEGRFDRRPVLPEERVEDDRAAAAKLFLTALELPTTSMRGIAWLLGDYDHEAQWVMRKCGIRTPERDRALVERALSTPPGPDAGMAAQMLHQLSWPDNTVVLKAIWERVEHVVEWVYAVTPETGWAIGDLVNTLTNSDKKRLKGLFGGVNPEALAKLIEAGGWSHIYSSMHAVGRITQAGGILLMRAVGEALDDAALSRMLANAPNLWSANELLSGLAYLNPDMGVRLFDGIAEQLARDFSPDPLGHHHELFETIAFLLGYAPGFLRRRRPAPAARRAARRFLRAIDKGPLISALSHPRDDRRWHNFPHFISFYQEADPRGFAGVVTGVDMGTLSEELANQMPRPSQNLLFVLAVLAEGSPLFRVGNVGCWVRYQLGGPRVGDGG